MSGQKFYYLRNAGALLELALVNWAMSRTAARGFTPITTPDLVKSSVLEKCGFQPRGDNTQVGVVTVGYVGWVMPGMLGPLIVTWAARSFLCVCHCVK